MDYGTTSRLWKEKYQACRKTCVSLTNKLIQLHKLNEERAMKVICSYHRSCEMKFLCDAAKPHEDGHCPKCPMTPSARCEPFHESSIVMGFHREDGDFQVLAALNNNDNLLSDDALSALNVLIVEFLAEATGEVIITHYRQVMPDYLEEAK